MPHDFGRGSTEMLLLCWSAFCFFLGVLPRGAFAGGFSLEPDIVEFSLAEQGKVTINDGLAPVSGSVQCSLAEQGIVTINDSLAPALDSAHYSLAELGTSIIDESVVPPLLLQDIFFFCCRPARSGSSEGEKLRLVCRVEGAMMFSRTDAILSVVEPET